MKKIAVKCIGLLAIVFGLTSCSLLGLGGSEGTIEAGSTALSEHDFTEAESQYCNVYNDDNTNSEAAFGCFFAKALMLPESDDSASLLELAGEDPVIMEQALYSPDDGLVTFKHLIEGGSFPLTFNYSDFNLPFRNFSSPGQALVKYMTGYKFAIEVPDSEYFSDYLNFGSLLNTIILNGGDSSSVERRLLAYSDELEEMEAILADVLTDEAFLFSVPQGFANTSVEPVVRRTDVLALSAMVKTARVLIGLIEGYDMGINIEDVVRTIDGVPQIDVALLVADINGSGATINGVTVDSIPALTLIDSSKIQEQKTRMIEALEHAQSALELWSSSGDSSAENSDFYGAHRLSGDHISSEDYENSADFLGEVSASGSAGMTQLSFFANRGNFDVRINLENFFDNPPDGTSAVNEFGSMLSLEDSYNDPVSYSEAEEYENSTLQPVFIEAFFRNFGEDFFTVENL